MIARVRRSPPLGFDPFAASVGLALIVGALAVVLPALAVLTGTLAALALASWAVRRRRLPRLSRGRRTPLRGGSVVLIGAAGVLYLDPPPPFAPFRSLGLALALVLFWVEAGDARSPRPWEGT
ncbi:MAG TPA: hypothetical protein VML94_05345 [Thermoplasmata archaeon]|nr:hypothetical protein [Thermoplasmata archaeon]